MAKEKSSAVILDSAGIVVSIISAMASLPSTHLVKSSMNLFTVYVCMLQKNKYMFLLGGNIMPGTEKL